MAHLEIHGPTGDRRVTLGATLVTIGRMPTSTVPINDTAVSRAHCVVERTVEGYRLRDLHSRNGTYLNDEPVESAALKDGDTIAVGPVTVRFSSEGD